MWTQSFGRLPGAIKSVDVKFDGRKDRATLVPIEQICSLEVEEADTPMAADPAEL